MKKLVLLLALACASINGAEQKNAPKNLEQKIDETLQSSYFQKQPKEIKEKILSHLLDSDDPPFFVMALENLMNKRLVSKEWRDLLSNQNLIKFVKDKNLSQEQLLNIFNYVTNAYFIFGPSSMANLDKVMQDILFHVGITKENLTQGMFDSFKNRGRDAIFFYIDAGADINSPNKDGITPLQAALENLNEFAVASLIAAHVNFQDRYLVQGNMEPLEHFLGFVEYQEIPEMNQEQKRIASHGLKKMLYGAQLERRARFATPEQLNRNGSYHQVISPANRFQAISGTKK